jgi:hypothetical protein
MVALLVGIRVAACSAVQYGPDGGHGPGRCASTPAGVIVTV